MNPYVLPAILAALVLLVIVIVLLCVLLHRSSRPQVSIRPVPIPRRTRTTDATAVQRPVDTLTFRIPSPPPPATGPTMPGQSPILFRPGRSDGRRVR